jgi:hypothetical protein
MAVRKMRRVRFPAIILAGIIASPLSAQLPIDSLSLRAHVQFLSSDLLEGRANGTRGQHLAAEYIAAQFARLGLEPLDSARNFRWGIPLTRVKMNRDSIRMTLEGPKGRTVIDGRRFYHFGGDSTAYLSFKGPVKYVGAMRSDVRGLSGAIAVTERTAGMPLDSVSSLVESLGAIALIVLAPDSSLYANLRNARGPSRYFVRERTNTWGDRRMPVLIADPGTRETFQSAATAALETGATYESVNTWNVLAKLPGTSPQHADQPLIYSAHYDHIGYARSIDGDSLYNGFMDNAVGVAAVLGIAEALRREPLRHPVYFLLTAAE